MAQARPVRAIETIANSCRSLERSLLTTTIVSASPSSALPPSLAPPSRASRFSTLSSLALVGSQYKPHGHARYTHHLDFHSDFRGSTRNLVKIYLLLRRTLTRVTNALRPPLRPLAALARAPSFTPLIVSAFKP
ncbi:hypothetical protein B0H13DRAFT_2349833 [Mycena leptocephala]|nr:hypothetical protein B0H13DRAFT_2349833 [Mycena leptocephala]